MPLPWPAVSFPLLGQARLDVIRRQVGERRGTAPKRARRLGGRRLAKRMAQLKHRQIGRPAVAGLPDHLQADPGERRIGVVPVLLPAPRRDVDLHVALDRRCAAHLNIRPLKIRPGLEIHETRMQHRDPAAVSGAKFAAVNALILPDLLQKMLRRRGVTLSQDGRHRLLAPL